MSAFLLLGHLNSLLQLLGLLALVLLVGASRPVAHMSAALRSASGQWGPSTRTATLFVTAILLLSLLSGALEQRETGRSPLVQLPIVGQLLSICVKHQRLELLIVVLSSVTLIWIAIVRTNTGYGAKPRQLRILRLWTLWLLASIVTTALRTRNVLGTELLPYIAASTSSARRKARAASST